LVSARAIIHASAHSSKFAFEICERVKSLRPDGWEKNADRITRMERFQQKDIMKTVWSTSAVRRSL